MANFLVIVDSDAARRARVCARVRPEIAPLPGLTTRELGAGDCAVLWAAGQRAPVDYQTFEDGLSVIWGRALPAGKSKAVTAKDVSAEWSTVPHLIPAPWDGYFAAMTYDPARGLVVGGDILGYFPLYWWSCGDATLVGSSPELFRHHPLFSAELDPTGLAGILLVAQSVGGRTLMKDVRRLEYGHLLHAAGIQNAMELEQYRMPCSTAYYDWPFTEHLTMLDEALDQCVRRQIASGPNGVLLSGGLDSRLLAGFLARQRRPVSALTFGVSTDFEAQCATKAAKTLGFNHRVADVDLHPAVECAERHARWFHVATGFNSIEYWNARAHVEQLPPYFTCGYALDTAMAPGYTGRSYSPETRTMSWDNYSRHVLAWGVGVDRLRRLLRREVFGDALEENLEVLRSSYDGFSEYPSKRHWMFGMLHRMRFHVAQMPWMFSFASWPVVPVLDQRFLEVLAGMPPATLGYRRAQLELVSTRFPELARLPLDRNSHNNLPIVPAWHHLLRHRVESKVRPWLARLPQRNVERRYYHRVYNLDSPGWRAIREHAAPHVEQMEWLFHRDALTEYLPAPDVPIATTDVFAESSGRKVLLGVSLWARDYLGDGASSQRAGSTAGSGAI